MASYKEWTLKTNWRSGCLLSTNQVIQIQTGRMDSGYSSVYMFREEDAEMMMNRGTVKGFRGPVGSNEIIIDCDEGEPGRKRIAKILQDNGYMYTLYSSGGKGYHFVIPMDRLIWDKNLPYSQGKWVEELGIQADMSLYRPTSLISLPGRVHPKTGLKKEYISTHPGFKARLKIVEMEFNFDDHEASESESLIIGLVQLEGMARVEPYPGNRHNSLWKTALSLKEAGVKYETALDLLATINASWTNPKDELELEAAVQQGYK